MAEQKYIIISSISSSLGITSIFYLFGTPNRYIGYIFLLLLCLSTLINSRLFYSNLMEKARRKEVEVETKQNQLIANSNAFDQYKEKTFEDIKLKKENDLKTVELNKENDIKMIEQLRRERSKGFPSLARAYEAYFAIQDKKAADYLRYKSHPAKKGALAVKEESKRRRVAEYDSKIYRSKLEYLFELFPYLSEYLDIDEPEEEIQVDSTYSEEEKVDPTTFYMPRNEWINLPAVERNDLALQRYWKRRKNNVEIGKMYERFIGYIFEKEGYQVQYTGIMQGVEDLGRDLVVIKDNSTEALIVQCKCWARRKKIHVAYINQLYGTATQYRMKNKDKDVKAVFYTTIGLDDTAKEFAEYLGIIVHEHYAMDSNYPCIKCNVSRLKNEKIYHLPFDQQYDKTIIEEERNECYVSTCKEAEALGFRRAFKWRPSSV